MSRKQECFTFARVSIKNWWFLLLNASYQLKDHEPYSFCTTRWLCVYLHSIFVSVCLCVYLVNYILPILDEGESAFAAVCIFSEVKGSRSPPQIHLPQCLPDCYFCLRTTVQVLKASTHIHTQPDHLSSFTNLCTANFIKVLYGLGQQHWPLLMIAWSKEKLITSTW